jgi:hypothetical protein
MRPDWLVLPLFLYLALDFSNPLMPGSVRFVEGSVEAVDSERARDALPLAADRPVVSHARLDVVLPSRLLYRPVPRGPYRRPAVQPGPRHAVLSPDPAPSPEDH